MKRNFPELEQRLIVILRKNSRKSIVDIADELGVSRITAKKILDSLIDSGRIKRFTINLEEEERDMVLVHTDNIASIPDDLVVERFELINNTYVVLLYYEDLINIKDSHIRSVDFVVRRELKEGPARMGVIHCDYCGNEIRSKPIVVELQGRTYYACCPNCERDLKKRREALEIRG